MGTKRKRKKALPFIYSDWPACGVCASPLNIEEDKPGSSLEDGILYYCWECKCGAVMLAGTFDLSFLNASASI